MPNASTAKKQPAAKPVRTSAAKKPAATAKKNGATKPKTTAAKSTAAKSAASKSANKTAAKKPATAIKKPGNKPQPIKTAAALKAGEKVRATEFAQDQWKLSDYDIISDVLGSHKNLIKLYGTALCEIGCKDLRNVVTSKMTECAEDQLDAFTYMNQRGMYKTEPAPVQKVKEARQRFCGCIKNIKK